ncbi:hypothetical protein [Fluviicola chungangensis]|uniref:Uncharacterized protein n=1 Tax=Fluviicola chungangensis TaxID=2597671 RepID=A0A556N2J5_9FLAO|nr:hypothetical protein [Fluviicola chungangensis]TSJ46269.1 hypothetical protein FO442_03700 [Fluviicola chungangensis]
MRLILVSIAAVGLLLGSCTSEPPVSIKKGTETKFDDQKITVDFKASSVLVNEEEQQTLIAPEGKIYIVVDVKAENSNYFLSLKEGDKEIEQVDFLVAGPFVRDLDIATSPDKSNLYLVDADGKYTIEINSFGDASATLNVGVLKDEATVKVSDRMNAFLNEFAEGGRILEAAKNYVKSGVNPYDITTENGEPMFGDPATKGLQITNIKADGTYVCSAELWYESVEVSWDGDNISKIVVTVK